MVIKLVSVLCISFLISTSIHAFIAKDQAASWVTTYLDRATPYELQLTANLLYFSYSRSAQTVYAQAAALEHLQKAWESWQNVAQTRLNPAAPAPYGTTHPLMFSQAVQEHHITNTTYAQVIKALVDHHELLPPTIRAGITALRQDARAIVSRAIIEEWRYVIELLKKAQEKLGASHKSATHLLDQAQENQDKLTKRSFLEYIPGVALSLFVQSDKDYARLSNTCWQAFFTSQEASKHLWESLEKARAHFYYTYYSALYPKLTLLAPQYCTILFDAQGLIEQSKGHKQLPAVTALIAFNS